MGKLFLGEAGIWTVNTKWILIAADFHVESNSLDRKSIAVVHMALKGPYILLMTTLGPMSELVMKPFELSLGIFPAFHEIPLRSGKTAC